MTIPKDCECRGTGWVKASIPAQFQAEYSGHSWGWAGCNMHFMEADDEPPLNLDYRTALNYIDIVTTTGHNDD